MMFPPKRLLGVFVLRESNMIWLIFKVCRTHMQLVIPCPILTKATILRGGIYKSKKLLNLIFSSSFKLILIHNVLVKSSVYV